MNVAYKYPVTILIKARYLLVFVSNNYLAYCIIDKIAPHGMLNSKLSP